MKKIICVLAVICMSQYLFAQDTAMSDKSMMHKDMAKMKDCVYMKDGKMMHMMNGKIMVMNKDLTMKNGIKIMTDGTVKMKDGTTKMMENGQGIDMDGKMSDMKMMDNDMMMHDSTKQE